MENITTDKWIEWKGNAKVFYNSNEKSRISFFSTRYHEIKPDVIYINGIYSLSYNIMPLLAARSFIKKNSQTRLILSPRGMLHPGALSQKRLKKGLFFMAFKSLRLHMNIRWHATDEKEGHFIRNKFKHASISIAGNFSRLSDPLPIPYKESGKLIMGTLALISPMKNHFEILKALQSIKQSIVWHVFGPIKDKVYWNFCKDIINQLPANIQVVYHGPIPPDKISSVLEKIHVFILPSKSENFGHSICEALSAGRPVITTDTTPYLNLQSFHAGFTIPVQQLNMDLIKSIQTFAALSSEELNVYSENARKYIHSRMDYHKIATQYQNLFSIA